MRGVERRGLPLEGSDIEMRSKAGEEHLQPRHRGSAEKGGHMLTPASGRGNAWHRSNSGSCCRLVGKFAVFFAEPSAGDGGVIASEFVETGFDTIKIRLPSSRSLLGFQRTMTMFEHEEVRGRIAEVAAMLVRQGVATEHSIGQIVNL